MSPTHPSSDGQSRRPTDLDRFFNDAMMGLQILFEAAEAGSSAAQKSLHSLSERLALAPAAGAA